MYYTVLCVCVVFKNLKLLLLFCKYSDNTFVNVCCVCMYVYMCVCIYVCMYICMYVCMYICTYMSVGVCMYYSHFLYDYIYCICVCVRRYKAIFSVNFTSCTNSSRGMNRHT